ncbi:DUF4232 domain-containing protein [Mycolicibacterium psychrotolerans]|uniref:DUF4232 domain-containing protein n=1 Tax=Mycolicibacterium psychrotolerans TaxID=216929 RepID=UPI0013CFE338|nr:DUF4232 domain-containing protein [Mycolicibacterium psychrotolerans]
MTTTPLLRATVTATALAVLLAGCGSDGDDQPVAGPAPLSSSAPEPSPTTPAPTSQPSTPSATGSEPAVPLACGNADLDVSAGPVSETDTTRQATVTFTNISPNACALVSFPGADLVTAAGGLLVHVARRPANSAPHLELQPREAARADVQASAVDTTTGQPCGRTGTLVVTAPNTTESHLLPVNLPICEATISAVG